MSALLAAITDHIEKTIPDFHASRIKSIRNLRLEKVLKRKNPYLFKAKNITTGHDLVSSVLDAFLSSQEETIFGTFLEQLALFVCNKVYAGKKSAAEGIDIEFQKDTLYYIMAVKSGPNWGNSSQIQRMRDTFKKAKRILQTNRKSINIIAVNGCCYGKNKSEDKGDYLKLCGQSFWQFISGVESLYIDLIEPIGHQAKKRNEEFQEEYAKVINQFTRSFTCEFCDNNGAIMWDKLVNLSSSMY